MALCGQTARGAAAHPNRLGAEEAVRIGQSSEATQGHIVFFVFISSWLAASTAFDAGALELVDRAFKKLNLVSRR
jgi:hypothetical protein